MFNFYVVLAGHYKATDAGRVPRAGANSKPPHYKQNVQKTKDLPKTWFSTGKSFEDFIRKKNKKISILDKTTP